MNGSEIKKKKLRTEEYEYVGRRNNVVRQTRKLKGIIIHADINAFVPPLHQH